MEKDLSDKISITCSILISVNITSETEVKSVIHKGKNETMEKNSEGPSCNENTVVDI